MRTARLSTTAGLLLAAWIAGSTPTAWSQHHHEDTKAGAARGDSVYELPASLVDQSGTRVGLDLFRGHPVLISMFYASCRDACPLLIADIQRIEAKTPPAARADLRVLLVSLDPGRDTPEVLRALARAHSVDGARWRFVTGPDDTVREIAAVLGIKYRRLAEGSFNHSSVVTLLDRSGVVRGRVEGLGQPHQALVDLLAAWATPRPRARPGS